jgi:hypothetical protein
MNMKVRQGGPGPHRDRPVNTVTYRVHAHRDVGDSGDGERAYSIDVQDAKRDVHGRNARMGIPPV